MSAVRFIGARMDDYVAKMIDATAREENVDKTKALKELIVLGRKQFLLKRYLQQYRDGKCSVDKAAEATGITVAEMMKEAAKEGITSTETAEDYREGLRLLK